MPRQNSIEPSRAFGYGKGRFGLGYALLYNEISHGF